MTDTEFKCFLFLRSGLQIVFALRLSDIYNNKKNNNNIIGYLAGMFQVKHTIK